MYFFILILFYFFLYIFFIIFFNVFYILYQGKSSSELTVGLWMMCAFSEERHLPVVDDKAECIQLFHIPKKNHDCIAL